MSKGIHVTSEIGKLNKVCLHRPGNELLNLPPFELERLLFDDVPFLKVAQEEHDAFADILRSNGVEVVYLEDLVAEAFDAHPEAREEFLNTYMLESGVRNADLLKVVREYLDSFKDNKEFVLHTMAGVAKTELEIPSTSGDTLASRTMVPDAESDLIVDPMPNLYFTRDPWASVGNGVNLNRMYSVTRNRETLYGKMVFAYHPDFEGTPLWFDRDVRGSWTEGGDVLNLNNHALAVGISQRTTAEAIDIMANNMFWHGEGCNIQEIYAFNIPNNRAMMHLDTVFTQIDLNKFTIHPAIQGTLQVFKLTKGCCEGKVKIEELNDKLENILGKILGRDDIQILPCGAGDPIAAAREQWNDGANTLAIAPGKIVVYQRNEVTNDFLYKNGLDLLVMPSAELSRGRGGPRCMSMPIQREDVQW